MENIYVFGAGAFFKRHKCDIEKKYNIKAILDNRIEHQIEQFENSGIMIYNPKMVQFLDDVLVFIMVKSCVDVCYQLLGLSVNGANIRFGYQIYPESEKEIELSRCGRLEVERNLLIYKKNNLERLLISSEDDLHYYETLIWENKLRERAEVLNTIKNLPFFPAWNAMGQGKGKPVDRYYIEQFLSQNKANIKGDILEVGDDRYTRLYGGEDVKSSTVLHVDEGVENTHRGNLETGAGILCDRYDTLIITQTLMFLYHIENAVRNIWNMLREGGNAFITVSGIAQVSQYSRDRWGEYFGFYEEGVRRLFEQVVEKEKMEITTYGNVKIATSLLYGLCCEDLEEEDFAYQDSLYPVIIAIRLTK